MTIYADKLSVQGADSNVKVPSYKEYGKLRVISFEFDIADIATPLLTGDTITGPKLPKNCMIMGAKIVAPSMGATGIFSLGNNTDNAGLIASADCGGQAVNQQDNNASTLIGTLIGLENSYLELAVLEDTINAAGKIQGFVTVIVE